VFRCGEYLDPNDTLIYVIQNSVYEELFLWRSVKLDLKFSYACLYIWTVRTTRKIQFVKQILVLAPYSKSHWNSMS